MANLSERHEQLARVAWDFSDLRALFINCTLKRSPEVSTRAASRTSRSRSWSATASRSRSSAPSTIRSRPASIPT